MSRRSCHVSAAVRARTILAACREVRMHLAVHGSDVGGVDIGSAGRQLAWAEVAVTGVVEWDGVPYLLGAAGTPPPSGRVGLLCSPSTPELGALILTGRCGRPLRSPELAGLAGDSLPPAPLRAAEDDVAMRVVPIVVERIRVSLGGPDDGTRRIVPVPLDLFRAARPDLWWAHGDSIAARLEAHHQAELRALVGLRAGVRGATGVVVRDVGPHGMLLSCLTLDGVIDQVIPFEPPLEEPAQLGAWFTR
ncbi:MAG TPA: hypothetical protein VI248_01975 [Kineosporiaceae bacterium]